MSTAPRKKKTARKPAARRSATTPRGDAGPPSLTSAHAKGFAAGVICGAIIGAASVIYLSRENLAPAAGEIASSEERDPGPQFDFFTTLPNQSLDLGSDVEPAALQEAAQARDLYVLQAGSFRAEEDADRRRGELALLGYEAKIEQTTGNNGQWFRVYIGPFETRSAMAQARSAVAQQSIDTLLLRRKRTP